jgi:hypothetical protein
MIILLFDYEADSDFDIGAHCRLKYFTGHGPKIAGAWMLSGWYYSGKIRILSRCKTPVYKCGHKKRENEKISGLST